eukprot:CAMPEP_0172538852 /NCGR_PEP_ID=MMETSP1067-20121228/10170_1 /TAXON_ID=265564 ORGANISM="Thalassiosira punctigera, Strain Tpunct2005C2" /NCGR_SAMPLE_ID=MMETSP1067 /ASSEMBLY_ACC=CAM_ASM_000444 /LENGTH=172 /DNA_ID=CAMNT_0013324441 /DNA_START=22 /DNA_END=538 /DNA_ORIENTATION=-
MPTIILDRGDWPFPTRIPRLWVTIELGGVAATLPAATSAWAFLKEADCALDFGNFIAAGRRGKIVGVRFFKVALRQCHERRTIPEGRRAGESGGGAAVGVAGPEPLPFERKLLDDDVTIFVEPTRRGDASPAVGGINCILDYEDGAFDPTIVLLSEGWVAEMKGGKRSDRPW